ncbi:hypothetical protein J6590_049597 [Homalodisca vitripennis]|nr:hypothetical protein J6590_049597 [Homalodisca vitripennis]
MNEKPIPFKPYSVRPHGPLACPRISSNRIRGRVDTEQDVFYVTKARHPAEIHADPGCSPLLHVRINEIWIKSQQKKLSLRGRRRVDPSVTFWPPKRSPYSGQLINRRQSVPSIDPDRGCLQISPSPDPSAGSTLPATRIPCVSPDLSDTLFDDLGRKC